MSQMQLPRQGIAKSDSNIRLVPNKNQMQEEPKTNNQLQLTKYQPSSRSTIKFTPANNNTNQYSPQMSQGFQSAIHLPIPRQISTNSFYNNNQNFGQPSIEQNNWQSQPQQYNQGAINMSCTQYIPSQKQPNHFRSDTSPFDRVGCQYQKCKVVSNAFETKLCSNTYCLGIFHHECLVQMIYNSNGIIRCKQNCGGKLRLGKLRKISWISHLIDRQIIAQLGKIIQAYTPSVCRGKSCGSVYFYDPKLPQKHNCPKCNLSYSQLVELPPPVVEIPPPVVQITPPVSTYNTWRNKITIMP